MLDLNFAYANASLYPLSLREKHMLGRRIAAKSGFDGSGPYNTGIHLPCCPKANDNSFADL